ncbi:phage tail tape measure protein [Deinococcus aquatilis]|uniref:phage tail tape measure protein n=1 Tax=Deinococcus aquatilis TaxID=519440 RepID=UPI00036F6CEC|nr:phage tail tape measure protein [Deinococcus aquatilis]
MTSGGGIGGQVDVAYVDVIARTDEQSLRQMEAAVEQAGATAGEKGGSGLKGALSGAIAGLPGLAVAAAAAIGTALVSGLAASVGIAQQVNQGILDLQASLGVTAEEAKGLGEVAKRVFGNNWGGDLAEAQQAVANVRKEIKGLSDTDLQAVTEGSLAIAERFEEDQSKVAAAVQALMKATGQSAQESLDFISAGFQKGLNSSGDFLDTLQEYSPQFEKAKITGDALFSLLETGAAKGALGTDKIADAFKEFGLTLIDVSDDSKGVYAELGLNQQKLVDQVNAGSLTQAQAFQMVTDKLKGVQGVADRTRIASAIFGGAGEDFGPGLTQLDITKTKISDLKGATDTVKNATNTLQGTFQTAWRQVQLALEPAGQELLKLVNDVMPAVSAGLNRLGPIVTSVVRFLVDGFRQGRETAEQFAPQFNQALNAVQPVVLALGSLFVTTFNLIKTLWETVLRPAFTAILPIVSTVFGGIASVVGTTITTVTNIVNAVSALLRGDWSKAWEFLAGAVVGALAGVEKYLTDFLPKILKLGGDLATQLIAGMQKGLDGLQAMILSALAKALTTLGDNLPPILQPLAQKLAQAAQDAADANVAPAVTLRRLPVQGPQTGDVAGPTSDTNSSEYQSAVALQALRATGLKTADDVVNFCAQWVRLTLGKADERIAPLINKLFQTDANGDGDIEARDAALNVKKAGLLREYTGPDDLKPGDTVFYTSNGQNHVGIFIGGRLVRGNNAVTYEQNGGQFDRNGNPISKGVNPVGNVDIDTLGKVSGILRANDLALLAKLPDRSGATPQPSPSGTATYGTAAGAGAGVNITVPLPTAAEQKEYNFKLADYLKYQKDVLALAGELQKAEEAHNTELAQRVQERIDLYIGENDAKRGAVEFAKKVLADRAALEDAANKKEEETTLQREQRVAREQAAQAKLTADIRKASSTRLDAIISAGVKQEGDLARINAAASELERRGALSEQAAAKAKAAREQDDKEAEARAKLVASNRIAADRALAAGQIALAQNKASAVIGAYDREIAAAGDSAEGKLAVEKRLGTDVLAARNLLAKTTAEAEVNRLKIERNAAVNADGLTLKERQGLWVQYGQKIQQVNDSLTTTISRNAEDSTQKLLGIQIAAGAAASAINDQQIAAANAQFKNLEATADFAQRQIFGQDDEGLLRSLRAATGFSILQIRYDVEGALAEARRLAPQTAGVIERVYSEQLAHRREVGAAERAEAAETAKFEQETYASTRQFLLDTLGARSEEGLLRVYDQAVATRDTDLIAATLAEIEKRILASNARLNLGLIAQSEASARAIAEIAQGERDSEAEAAQRASNPTSFFMGMLGELKEQGLDPRKSGFTQVLEDWIDLGGPAGKAAQVFKDNLNSILVLMGFVREEVDMGLEGIKPNPARTPGGFTPLVYEDTPVDAIGARPKLTPEQQAAAAKAALPVDPRIAADLGKAWDDMRKKLQDSAFLTETAVRLKGLDDQQLANAKSAAFASKNVAEYTAVLTEESRRAAAATQLNADSNKLLADGQADLTGMLYKSVPAYEARARALEAQAELDKKNAAALRELAAALRDVGKAKEEEGKISFGKSFQAGFASGDQKASDAVMNVASSFGQLLNPLNLFAEILNKINPIGMILEGVFSVLAEPIKAIQEPLKIIGTLIGSVLAPILELFAPILSAVVNIMVAVYDVLAGIVKTVTFGFVNIDRRPLTETTPTRTNTTPTTPTTSTNSSVTIPTSQVTVMATPEFVGVFGGHVDRFGGYINTLVTEGVLVRTETISASQSAGLTAFDLSTP